MGLVASLLFRKDIRSRHRDLIAVVMRFARGDLARALLRGDGPSDPEWARLGEGSEEPAQLAEELEKLGPVAVKIGQTLSAQSDLLPPRYVEALTKLQSDIQPFPSEQVREIVEEDLGRPLEALFRSFDEEPLAAASIGQVHRGITLDGRQVSVKVLRPNIRRQIELDFEAFQQLAALVERRLEGVAIQDALETARRTMLNETDYEAEARNMQELGAIFDPFDGLRVVQAYPELCSPRVLTMEFMLGTKITEATPEQLERIDGERLAEELLRSYLQQILVAGLFHADPHPGNMLLLNDDRLGLIDCGMVGRVGPQLREQLLMMVLALAEGRGERVARLMLDVGQAPPNLDHHGFVEAIARLVVENHNSDFAQLRLGQVMLATAKACQRHTVRLPDQIPQAGRALAYLESAVRILAPDLDPTRLIREEAAGLIREHLGQDVTLLNAFDRMLRARDLAERIPAQVARLLDMAAEHELQVKVDAIDERELLRGLQKIANRVAAGLVLAAMIVGAALVMRVESSYTLLGYPALAIVMFVLAGLGGAFLVFKSLFSDY
ncbi:MAG: AarF/UbiB family protein [Planctomycetota bacterium]